MQRFLQQHDEVELSALGLAIATVVTVAEILKNNGLVVQKRAPSLPKCCSYRRHRNPSSIRQVLLERRFARQ